MDLDVESDFLFTNEYKQIVLNQFYELMNKDNNKSNLTAKDVIPEIKALKSQNIKNHLIENSVEAIDMNNANYEKTYHDFLSIATDSKFKESLTQKYNAANESQPGKPSIKFDYEN
ncbi:hypothetical protein [Flavobacterium sp. TAB 87]|uniref:hypothetical protein n=1 Tax=Flavobacterium sp. TAB 87 TaxID=1729581 RepID=UPI00076C48CA|nr:hypothetical protein AP058_01171 [Flavobacterium sp. TAB 87]